jgi:hypothetical protein
MVIAHTPWHDEWRPLSYARRVQYQRLGKLDNSRGLGSQLGLSSSSKLRLAMSESQHRRSRLPTVDRSNCGSRSQFRLPTVGRLREARQDNLQNPARFAIFIVTKHNTNFICLESKNITSNSTQPAKYTQTTTPRVTYQYRHHHECQRLQPTSGAAGQYRVWSPRRRCQPPRRPLHWFHPFCRCAVVFGLAISLIGKKTPPAYI